MLTAVSRSPRGRARNQHLEARMMAEQKMPIESAAALRGRMATDFVPTSVQHAAPRAIEEHQQLELAVRISQAFVEVLGPHHGRGPFRSETARDRSAKLLVLPTIRWTSSCSSRRAIDISGVCANSTSVPR
jgi:uncharacterized protein (DUF1778 family)